MLSEHTAAESRASALERDTLGHFWRSVPLQKWNARREILFLALEDHAHKSADMIEGIANALDYLPILESRITKAIEEATAMEGSADTPVRPEAATMLQWHRFLPAAARVLWLAHHTPADWHHLRADPAAWLQQIEAWADENIPDDQIEAAVRLAHLLRTEHRQFITIPRPEKSSPRTDAGN